MNIREHLDWEKASQAEGWLTPAEGRCLFRCASELQGKGCVVEIGSWKGRSTVCLAQGLQDGTQLYAIDPHTGSEEHRSGEAGVWTFDQFRENLERAGLWDRVTPLLKTSEQAAREWNEPIELLFIDGAHDEASVRRDFEMFWPHVVEGGWVLMHDTTGIWQPGLAGWAGPRRVAYQKLFCSREIGGMVRVDTITAGQRVAEVSVGQRIAKLGLWLRKCPQDLLSIGINTAARFPAPVTNALKTLFRRN